jgi:hypothetical protein
MVFSPAQAADSLTDFILDGHVSGQLRLFYIDRAFTGIDAHRYAFAIGGHLRYDTAIWHGLQFGGALYATGQMPLGQKRSRVDPSLFGKGLSSYILPAEAWASYSFNQTTVKVGRQQLHTPLVCDDDVRMIPCHFEAVVIRNQAFDSTELTAAHVFSIAPGTIANSYPNGGVLAVTAGYSFIGAQSNDRFHNMGQYAIGESTAGVSLFGARYEGLGNVTLQAWNYFAWDIFYGLYLQGDFRWQSAFPLNPEFSIAGQYILQQSLGRNRVLSNINTHYGGVQLGASVDGLSLSLSFSQTGSDPNAAINGGVIAPWAGIPAFTQGMVTRHMFMAGTRAWKIAGSYDWQSFGIDLTTAVYYAAYDMSRLNGYSPGHQWTARETGFDLIYQPHWADHLTLRTRGNFTFDFFQNHEKSIGWNELRFIVNYDF